MELLWLEYFKKVAETGRISAAAESLYISPPSLSATISRLEKELGVKLFNRTSNSISLNEQGEIFLKYTNRIFSCLEQAREEIQKSTETSTSHISMATTFSNLWVGLICAFSADCPEITISNTTLKLSQLPSGSISPAWSFLFVEEGDIRDIARFNSLTLIDGDLPVLAINPSHRLAKKKSIDLRETEGETYCLPTADMSLNKIVKELLELSGIRQKSSYEYPYMMRRELIAENRGISFSTEYACKFEDTGLSYVPITTPAKPLRHMILWDKDRPLTAEEETFLSFCRDYCQIKE